MWAASSSARWSGVSALADASASRSARAAAAAATRCPGRVDLGGGRAAVVLAELFEIRVEVGPGRGQRFGRAVDLAIDHHALDRGEGVAHVFDGRLVGIGDARGHRGRSELLATHLQPGRLDLQRLEVE